MEKQSHRQEANLHYEHDRPGRAQHVVHHHLPPALYLIGTVVGIAILITYSVTHQQDIPLISATVVIGSIVCAGLWYLVSWGRHFIEGIIQPIVHTIAMWKKTRILAQHDRYLYHETSGFHAVTHVREITNHNQLDGSGEPPALPPPAQPDLSTILEALPHNQLAFTYGMDRETGAIVRTTLPKAVHIQLIGSTGQGKSRQSTSILTQLCATNDQEHLHLALLDIEGETSAPFQRLPHVRYTADEPERAARVLHSLVGELERRDQVRLISPAVLIFVEEFLNLRRIMPGSVRDQALEDWTTLALRGRKRGMYLFSVGQTSYSEKSIRDAQGQFQSSMAFAAKPTMARAAGFTNTELLNQLWKEKRPGQFLLEQPSGDNLLLAPFVNTDLVPALLEIPHSQGVPDAFPPPSQVVVEADPGTDGNEDGKHPELDIVMLARLREMVSQKRTQSDIVADLFPGMRNADAVEMYRYYLSVLINH